MKNQHSRNIPGDILEQANQLVDQLITLLAEYLLSLTPGERKDMLKMGDKTLGFVEKSGEFARNNPNLRPSYLNMEDYEIDLADALGLRGLLNKLQQVTNGVDDTMMMAGSEAYVTSLTFYLVVKEAARRDVPGAKAVYEELKKRFPGRGHAKPEEEASDKE